MSEQTWQSGEVLRAGGIGVEFNFVLNVWIKPAFDSLLIIFAYVAVNVDSTTGAGTLKCTLIYIWKATVAEANICEAGAIRERTIADAAHLAHGDGLQAGALHERKLADAAHIAHGDGFEAGAAQKCTVTNRVHLGVA